MSILAGNKKLVTAVFPSFDGGRVTALPAHRLGPNQSPGAPNVLIDEVAGAVVTRRGARTIGTLPSGLACRTVLLFKKADGTERLICSDGATVYSTNDGVTFTSIKTGLNSAYDLEGAMVRDKLWMTNGTDAVFTYDGTNVVNLDGTGGNPNVPKGRYIVFALGRVWILNRSGNESTASYSALFDSSGTAIAPDNANAWPSANALDIALNDGDQLYAAIELAGTVFFFKARSIHRLAGLDELSFGTVLHLNGVGTRFFRSVAFVDGIPHFVGPDGIYEMAGGAVRNISRLIQPDFDDLLQPDIRYPFKTWTTTAEFDAGTHSDTSAGVKPGKLTLAVDTTDGRLVDQFTDGDYTSSPTWSVGAGAWAAAAGYLTPTTRLSLAKIATPQELAYGVWQVDFTIVSTNSQGPYSGTGAGVFAKIRFAQHSNGDYYELRVTSANPYTVTLHKYVNGTLTSIGTGTFTITPPAANSSVTTAIKIVRTTAGAITVYKDGVSKITVTDTAITGSATFDLEGMKFDNGAGNFPTEVRFDNVYFPQYVSSGTWTADVQDEGTTDKSDWGIYQAEQTLNGQTATHKIRAADTNPPGGSYTTMTLGLKVPLAVAATRYMQVQIALSTTDTAKSPEIDVAKLNWLMGGKAEQQIAAIGYKGRYWVAGARKSTAATVNDVILVRARREFTAKDQAAAWMYFTGLRAGQMVEWQGNLFCGDVGGSGRLLRLDTGYRDVDTAGADAAIDGYWDTRDEAFGVLPNMKNLLQIIVDFKQKGNWALSVDYSKDGGVSYTAQTVNLAGSARSDKVFNVSGGVAKTFRFRLRTNAQDQPFEAYSLAAKALPSLLEAAT